ncbi:hypothetical protein D3C81_1741050 [compost metagenome]
MNRLIHALKVDLYVRMRFLKGLHHILKNIQHLSIVLFDPEMPERQRNFLRLLLLNRLAAINGDNQYRNSKNTGV